MISATTQHGQAGADLGRLFDAAFKQSRNPMALMDGSRRLLDVNGPYLRFLGYTRQQLTGHPIHANLVGGPIMSEAEFVDAVAEGRYVGLATYRDAAGNHIHTQFAGTAEVISGSYRILVVILSTSRWGKHFRRESAPAGTHGTLSAREREIVSRVAMGETGPEIADGLQIAHDTVRTHVRNAMEKMDARSRAHLVAKALGQGVILHDVVPLLSSTSVPDLRASANA